MRSLVAEIARKRLAAERRIRTAAPAAPLAVETAWRPNSFAQLAFYESRADEVLYGGAAGGGKSAVAVATPLQWVHLRDFRALILRRETTQLQDLLDKAEKLYRKLCPAAVFNKNTREWTFPAGATIRLNHCKDPNDAFDYQGREFQYVDFDELTHFLFDQYREIRSRVRSASPDLPRYTRSQSNPGGIGHDWVFRRWGPWLDPDCKVPGLPPRVFPDGTKLPPALPGQVLWFVVNEQGKESWVPEGTEGAQSRTFLPARLTDNPALAEHDPNYAAKLRDQNPVRRAQLEDGNWLVKPAKGLYFKRDWWRYLDARPPSARLRIRSWDLGATEDGDWTRGVLMAHCPEQPFPWVVEDVASIRGAPGTVKAFVLATAQADGTAVQITVPQDPGQAGVDQAQAYIAMLAGWTVRSRRPTGDKVTRASPYSSQVQGGNVALVRASWNLEYVTELEEFNEGTHDDQVDASSDAFNELRSAPNDYVGPVDDGWMEDR